MLFIYVIMFVDDIWIGGGNIMHILQDYVFVQIRTGDKGLLHSFPFSLPFYQWVKMITLRALQ